MWEESGAKLYHYTTIKTLQGILENNELWLGNTASMNDKSEIIHFLNGLQNTVKKEVGDNNKCDEFFDKIYKRIENEYPYAMCFSQSEDDAAQWERYANAAKGICIVFNTSTLYDLFGTMPFILQKVYYSYDERTLYLFKILVDYFKTGNIHEFKNTERLIDNIIITASSYKHSSFSSEKEVRLVTLSTDTILECADKYADLEFINKNDCVRSVLKVYLDKLCKNSSSRIEDIISNIVIGPRSLQSEYELKKYMYHLGLNSLAEKISVSKCPLR
jgi:hypothetical protein